MKVCTPDIKAVEIDGVSGRRYKTQGGIYDMTPADAKATVSYGGFFPSMSGTTRADLGYRCTSCGFGSFFKMCSRCGGHAAREA